MLRNDEQYVYNVIERSGGMLEVEEAVKLIHTYRSTSFYESKDKLLASWEIDLKGIYEFVISVFTACLTEHSITYQEMVGRLNHKIKIDDELGRIKIVADLIGLVSKTELIDITSQRGEYHMLSTDYIINNIPMTDRHKTITLRPQPVEENYDREGTGSVILGHGMNHHEEYLRLSYLDLMGQVPLKLNKEFIRLYEECPKYELEDSDEIAQWEYFRDVSSAKYKELMNFDQRFFDQWKFDSRGRSYSCSYYLDVQGSSFKKAIIELAEEEYIGGF